MTPEGPDGRLGISIACVFNNADVRRNCLDQSIECYQGPVDIDYIPIDNIAHSFTSAGAALNLAASRARYEVIVFVHQDVYLHSIDRLAEAASAFGEGQGWGMLGATGVTAGGRSFGRLRDRTRLIGLAAKRAVQVQTVDEVLFMVSRHLVIAHPLSEASELAWHAYAVEYSARLSRLGLRVGAIDLAITHNSLTANTGGLDEAHQAVGRMYPGELPIQTTCGVIGGWRSRLRDWPVVRRHGWRARWLYQSWLASRARRRIKVPVVLADVRDAIDLLPKHPATPVQLINLDSTAAFMAYAQAPLQLERRGRLLEMTAVSGLDELVRPLPDDNLVLVVGLSLDDLTHLRSLVVEGRPWVLGIQAGEMWLLGGLAPHLVPGLWSRPGAAPLGSRAATRAFRRCAIHQGA